MRFEDFQKQLPLSIFTSAQADKVQASQLARWVKRGRLIRLKQGLYQFIDRPVDEFSLAGFLYQPAYISLETALNNLGIMPDVSANVTSVSPTTTKIIKTVKGVFYYSKIKQELFFGWQAVKDLPGGYYKIAFPEKALLDWIYLRKIKNLTEYRLNLNNLSKQRLAKFSQVYPNWVRRVIYEQFNR